MNAPEKFDLAEMLAEIERDAAAESPPRNQQSDISQSVITTLVQKRIGDKESTDE